MAGGGEPEGTVEIGDSSLLVGVELMCAERADYLGGWRRRVLHRRSRIATFTRQTRNCEEGTRSPPPRGDPDQRPALVSALVAIEDGVWIGIGAIILKGVRVGTGAQDLPRARSSPRMFRRQALSAATPAGSLCRAGKMTLLEHDWYPRGGAGQRGSGRAELALQRFRVHSPPQQCQPSVRIGSDSGVYISTYFDLGPKGQVVIGTHCTVAGTVFRLNDRITIGDYALISNRTVIADSFAASSGCSPARRPGLEDRGSEHEIRIMATSGSALAPSSLAAPRSGTARSSGLGRSC